MTDIVINKRVSLDFLGDDYQDSYLIIKYVPVKEYDQLMIVAQAAADKKQSIKFIQEQIKQRFVEGKVKQGSELVSVKAEDLESFPADVFITAYQEITGQVSPNA